MAHRLLVGGELVLYGDVGRMWYDDDGFTATDVMEALAEFGSGDLTVRLNSGGGLAFEGITIFNLLRSHDGRITMIIDGIAASAASVIAMAGDSRIMRLGSMLMIHDPSSVTWGDAQDHRNSADRLDALATNVAGIYARISGKGLDDVRDMMRVETWMSAEQALEGSFATAVDEEAAEEMSAFAYDAYQHAPSTIPQAAYRQRPKLSANPSAPAAKPKDHDVTAHSATAAQLAATTTLTPPAMAAAAAPAAAPALVPAAQPAPAATTPPTMSVRDATMDIMSRCRSAKLSSDQTFEVVEKAAGNVEAAKDLIIIMMADRDPQPNITSANRITADGRDRFREGVTLSLMHKAGMQGGQVNEFTGYTLKELARLSLQHAGMKFDYADPLEMAGAALGMVTMLGGTHTTSDFVTVLGNVANKSMLRGYEEAEETFEIWTARGVLNDFKEVSRVDIGLFPSLKEVPEGGEYKFGTVGDRGEKIQLATYGRMFAISRQAIINDDMNVFTRIPQRMGRAARRTIGDLVYAILVDNPPMSDGKPLFHTDHGNLAATNAAPTVVSLDAARAAMAKQKDVDGLATSLNIRAKYMLVPVELEGVAKTLMAAEFDPSKTQRVPNSVRDMAQVVSDARLSGTAWHLAADPNTYDTIEVAYLNGNSQPTLEQRPGWYVDGAEFKVRIDAGVKAIGYHGLYKNAGAAPA
ncbi:ClpP-like prohead protease/major capsid protein fusion protein [Antarcticirhabdus aurantiaca]|uniref:Clp protease ClpP n=1 Tax=Antarcticirhabdus aurantiaca TaxID=2606717 RepID=A0ACD4NJA7_9HYPH|nr:Clp protease ClpP [Jeongeuplla avenae]